MKMTQIVALAGLGAELNGLGACCASCAVGGECSNKEPPTHGFGEEGYATSRTAVIETGDYHIVGTQVILRAQPDASSARVATLQNGEGVYVFGDVETDPAHMVGPNGLAVPNDGSSDGIEYARIGTQAHGPGWVATNFIQIGAGATAEPQPAPAPLPSPTPAPATLPKKKKDYVMPVVVGGLIGVAVLGGIALAVRAMKSSKSRRSPAYA